MSVIRTKNRIQFAEDFVLNNGKIGIATNDPQQALDVVGSINATGLVTASQLSAGLYQGEVRFLDNVFIDGDISIAGTSAIVDTQTLRINDADIILGFTTNQNGDDVSSDTTANHGGIAIASTEGTPLSRVVVAGIETLPATYKKIMWFKSDTFAGVSTDAWMFNYGVSIGNTTNVPNGTRLAAGNVLVGQNDITSVRNINATGIITGGTANFDTYTNLNVEQVNVIGVSTFNEDVTIDANLTVNGTSTLNDAVTVSDGGVLVGTISSTTIKFGGIGTDPYIEVEPDGLEFVGVSTFTDTTIFDSTGSIQIPVGTTPERPGVAVTGQIRYNTDTVSFEGYGPGGAWGSLGGVKDVDGDTYILPETSSGSDEDTLFFYAADNLVGTISSTTQKFGGILSYPELEKGDSGGTLTNGNLTFAGVQSDGNFESALSTFASGSTGKYYAEVTIDNFNNDTKLSYGVIGASKTFDYNAVVGSQDAYAVTGTGSILNQGSNQGDSGIASLNYGHVIGILLNLDNNELSYSQNGTVVTSTPISIPADALGYKFAISVEGVNEILTVNFGETAFSSLPAGYQGITQSSPYVEVESSGIDFVGVSTFADDLTVSGALSVAGDLNIVGDTIFDNISVSGVSTFNDTVTFNPNGLLVGTISSTTQKFGGAILGWPELESTNGNAVLTNNNLSLSSSDSDGSTSREVALSTIAATSGKIYAEISIDTLNPDDDEFISYGIVGVSEIPSPFNYDNYFGFAGTNSIGMRGDNAFIRYNGSGSASGISTGITQGVVMGLLLDLDNNELTFSYNGSIGNSRDISPYLDPLGFKIGASVTDSTQLITLNFGETPFAYQPAGYEGLYNSAPYVEVDQDGLEIVGVSTFTDDLTVSGALSVTGDLDVTGISTFNDTAIFNSTGSIQIPVGTTAERPGIAVTGQIRYNTNNSSFEGYGPGGAWGSLGGVKDVDGDTYILAETSAGSDEDTLYFYTGGELTGTISTTNGITGDGENIRSVYAPEAALASYASHSATSNSALSIAGVSTYTEVGILTAGNNTDGSDFYGNSIACSADGKTIVVGASQDELPGGTTDTGVVYVYDRVGNSFNEVGILTGSNASDTSDEFGSFVAVSADGKTIAVGAQGDEITTTDTGVVYIFDRNGDTFTEVSKFKGSTAGFDDDFGNDGDLSADGKVLAVAAVRGGSSTEGLVYVFDRVGNSYNEVAILESYYTKDSNDRFGQSLSMSADGKTIVVGASQDEITGAPSSSGVVYVFDRDKDDNYNVVGILTGGSLVDASDTFGFSVACSADGNVIAVGAISDEFDGNTETGVVRVFDRVNSSDDLLNNFSQVGIFEGTINGSDQLGWSVEISADGNTVISGARNDDTSASSGGAVRVYKRQGDIFNQVDLIIGSQTGSLDRFGTNLAISADGKYIYVSTESGEFESAPVNSGIAYAFNESRETYVYSDAEGNIGIGSAIPTEKLDVDGNIAVSGNYVGDLTVTGITSTGITTTGDLTVNGSLTITGDIISGNSNNVSTSGTFTASPGVAYTMESFTLSSNNVKTAEYTIHIENGTDIQSQKLLVMQNGTTAFSQEYAIMFDVDLIASVSATLTSGVVNVELTPESGVSGLTTYRYIRQSMI